MQEEVTQKTLTFYIRTTKLTASVFQKAIMKYLRSRSQKKAQAKSFKRQKKLEKKYSPKGKVKVKDLAAQNAGMTNIEITNKNIKSFERHARKYGVNYALKKDNTKDPPVYMVFFKARDQDAINAAFREYTKTEIKKANKESIHNRLQKYKGIVSQQKKDKVRTRHQELDR